MLERRGPRLSRRFAAKRAANGCQPCNYPVELFLYLGMFFGESCRVSTYSQRVAISLLAGGSPVHSKRCVTPRACLGESTCNYAT